MKYIKTLLVILTISFAGALMAQDAFPNIEVKTLDGQTVNLKDYTGKGKITLVDFWATWCLPCQKELDVLADLYPDWQEEYGVEIVAVTLDTRRALAKVAPMVETKGWEYTILSDTKGNAQEALSFQPIPQVFLVDQNGNIVYAHTGFEMGDEEELEEIIAKLAKK